MNLDELLDQNGCRFATVAMPDAFAALRGSAFARDWLGTGFVEAFAASRESQYDQFRAKVPDVELIRYFDLG